MKISSTKKVSSTSKWILTIGILLILVAAAAILYVGQQAKHSQLSDDLDAAQKALMINSQQKDQLQSTLADLKLAVAQDRASFPAADQSMDVEQALFGAADEAGVRLVMLSCSEPKPEKVGQVTYKVFILSLGVEGEAEALLQYTGLLGYWLPSVSVESASLSLRGGDEAVLSMSLKVYALEAA